jgi:hypothetical protein
VNASRLRVRRPRHEWDPVLGRAVRIEDAQLEIGWTGPPGGRVSARTPANAANANAAVQGRLPWRRPEMMDSHVPAIATVSSTTQKPAWRTVDIKDTRMFPSYSGAGERISSLPRFGGALPMTRPVDQSPPWPRGRGLDSPGGTASHGVAVVLL